MDEDNFLQKGDYNINRKGIDNMGLEEIYEAINIYTKQKYLCKLIKINLNSNNENSLNEVMETIKIHKKLENDNISKLITFIKGNKTIYLFFDYVEGKSLKFMAEERKKFLEKEIYCIINQVMDAIVYLYDNNIILKNLKLENILFRKDEKILLCNLEKKNLLTKKKKEYLTKNAYIRIVLRIGIIICELLDFDKFIYLLHSNNIKIIKENHLALIKEYYKTNILNQDNLSNEFKNLIAELLKDENNRINIATIKSHEWFLMFSSNNLYQNNAISKKRIFEEKSNIDTNNISSIRESVRSNIANNIINEVKEEIIITDEPYLDYYQKEREVLLGLIDSFDENEIKNNMKLAEKYKEEKAKMKNENKLIKFNIDNNIMNVISDENEKAINKKGKNGTKKKKGFFSFFTGH